MSEAAFPLQPLCELVTAIKDGTHGTHRRVRSGVPLLSAKNITAGGYVAYDNNDDLISEAEFRDLCRSFQLEPNDLLLTIVGSLGRRAIYSGQRVTFQRSVAYVRPQQRRVLSRFLFHWMGHPAFSRELARRSNATAQAGLYLGELAKVSVPVPDETNQRAISQILDTLDTAIHETEAIIAKLKAVKQGLLHDLLTRGVDANGELRPPQTAAPQLYRASAAGWVPKRWSVRPLGEVGEFMNGLNKPKHAFGSGTKFVNISDVYPDYLDAFALGRVQTTPSELNRYLLNPGDIVLDRSSVKLAGVGYPSVFMGHEEPVVFCGFIIRWRATDLHVTVPRYLCLQMRDARFRNEVFKIATGGANINVNQAALKELAVVLPDRSEQKEVINRERALDDRLESETHALQKLRAEKSGLMDDLLTGRVRVTPLLTRTGQMETEGSV